MKRYLIVLFFFFTYNVSSQELLSDLICMPALTKSNLNYINKSTLTLPFVDDFSNSNAYLDNNLWDSSSSVFINSTYAINPPTIGVATFDGLDLNRMAYSLSVTPSQSSDADTLLSKEIDMSGNNSVYFFFYYQPQGIGDNPQVEDSLILEFKDINNDWKVMWKKPGSQVTAFKKKSLLINSSDYLHNSFQFRFRNKATVSGNFDHWHIDYIKIDEYNIPSDTTNLGDVSFVYNSPSLLERYNEMPWSHFLNNESTEARDTLILQVRNNNSSINVSYKYNIYNDDIQTGYYPNQGGNLNYTILDYDSVGNFLLSVPVNISSINSISNDTAIFIMEHILGSTNDYKNNDTLYKIQRFLSHFSYDDGIAESAYGINMSGAKIAYEFNLNRPDTLRAIQMYFPQMLDSVSDVPFKLTVWSDINGPGSIIYQQEVYPVHTDSGNFHTYYLDSLFQLVGVFYVGWEQTTDDLINIGFDKNLSANSYMYYNIGSGWNNSQFIGSWMIRPIVSQKPILSISKQEKKSFLIYPNPTDGMIFLRTDNVPSNLLVYNTSGVLVKEVLIQDLLTALYFDDLPPSLYLLELLHSTGHSSYHKLFIR